MKIWSRNLDQLICKLKYLEKHLDLQTYQQLNNYVSWQAFIQAKYTSIFRNCSSYNVMKMLFENVMKILF